jgi:hypothetical protein
MRKRTQREIQRQSHWEEIVRRQGESGQSARAYCQQAGIEESAFYWWRRELARRSQQRNDPLQPSRGMRQREPIRPGARGLSKAVTEVGFLPVQVATDRGAEAVRAIEMVLGGDRVLRIPPGFDRQTLLNVLGTLEDRGC